MRNQIKTLKILTACFLGSLVITYTLGATFPYHQIIDFTKYIRLTYLYALDPAVGFYIGDSPTSALIQVKGGKIDGRDLSVDGAKLDTFEAGATADQNASEVPNTPAGDIIATDVQAAINELDTDKAAKSNVLELDNTDAFTPDADYEPATKKYVDDNVFTNPLTTKGDLLVYTTGPARFPVGTDGYMIIADSSEPSGMKWVPITGVGDMLAAIYDPAGIAEQLVGLTAAQVLANKIFTAPQINDSALNNQYIFSVADITANRTISLPLLTSDDTFVFANFAQTLTNKTLTSPVINSPTGIVKGDVGLDQVDNTSDATKNAATATLTNKTLISPIINIGSDADGDLYTRVSGVLVRITKGTIGQVLFQGASIPYWGNSTSASLAGLTDTTITTPISGQVLQYDGANWINATLTSVVTSGTPVANDFARFTDANTIEGRSYSEVRADLGLEIGTDVLAQQAIGIADNNLVEIDSADVADDEYARFTVNGLESRSVAEVKTDLAIDNVANVDTTNASNISSGTLDGDRLPAISATKKGAVPATGTPSGKYLKDDGTWSTVAGGGTIDDTAWDGTNWNSTTNGISADKIEGALEQVGIRYEDRTTNLNADDNDRIVKLNSVAGTFTTDFTETLSTSSDYTAFTMRIVIPASEFSEFGDHIKIRFQAGSSTLGITKAFIGNKADSGNAWDFNGDQVQLTFNGNTSYNLVSGQADSDLVNYFNFDNSKDLVVSVYCQTSGYYATYGSSVADTYNKSGDSAGDTAPASYNTSTVGYNFGIQAVKIAPTIIDYRLSNQKVNDPWFEIDSANYTATPASTSTITMSDTSDFAAGKGIKYTDSRGTFRAFVSGVTSTTITIKGALFNVANDLTEVAVCDTSRVLRIPYFIPGQFGAAAEPDCLRDIAKSPEKNLNGAMYFAYAEFAQNTIDGTSQPIVNLTIAGSSVLSSNLTLGGANTWILSSAVGINTANYKCDYGDAIELAVTTASGDGSSTASQNLTVNTIWILE